MYYYGSNRIQSATIRFNMYYAGAAPRICRGTRTHLRSRSGYGIATRLGYSSISDDHL